MPKEMCEWQKRSGVKATSRTTSLQAIHFTESTFRSQDCEVTYWNDATGQEHVQREGLSIHVNQMVDRLTVLRERLEVQIVALRLARNTIQLSPSLSFQSNRSFPANSHTYRSYSQARPRASTEFDHTSNRPRDTISHIYHSRPESPTRSKAGGKDGFKDPHSAQTSSHLNNPRNGISLPEFIHLPRRPWKARSRRYFPGSSERRPLLLPTLIRGFPFSGLKRQTTYRSKAAETVLHHEAVCSTTSSSRRPSLHLRCIPHEKSEGENAAANLELQYYASAGNRQNKTGIEEAIPLRSHLSVSKLGYPSNNRCHSTRCSCVDSSKPSRVTWTRSPQLRRACCVYDGCKVGLGCGNSHNLFLITHQTTTTKSSAKAQRRAMPNNRHRQSSPDPDLSRRSVELLSGCSNHGRATNNESEAAVRPADEQTRVLCAPVSSQRWVPEVPAKYPLQDAWASLRPRTSDTCTSPARYQLRVEMFANPSKHLLVVTTRRTIWAQLIKLSFAIRCIRREITLIRHTVLSHHDFRRPSIRKGKGQSTTGGRVCDHHNLNHIDAKMQFVTVPSGVSTWRLPRSLPHLSLKLAASVPDRHLMSDMGSSQPEGGKKKFLTGQSRIEWGHRLWRRAKTGMEMMKLSTNVMIRQARGRLGWLSCF